MSRSRDNRRCKARARRRLRTWWRRRFWGRAWYVIDDPIRRPIADPREIRSFVEALCLFGESAADLAPHLESMGVHFAERASMAATMLTRHTESGRVCIEDLEPLHRGEDPDTDLPGPTSSE